MERVQNNKILQGFVLGFLLVVLISTPFFFVTSVVQAQQGDTSEAAPAASVMNEGAFEALRAQAAAQSTMYNGAGGFTSANPSETAAAVKDQGKLKPLTALGNLVGNMVLDVASRITWVGGKILEVSMDKLVIGMGDMINNKGLGIVIHQAWTTVRDICNLAFIFGFIYIGIKTIIDADSGSSKKFLASIIIGAVLINFSLFFTKAIIDVSNYIAVEIHNTMLQGSGSISMKIADILKIESIYKTPGSDPAILARLTGVGNVAYFIMGALFLIIAGFVLAVGGILLIFRFVQLVFIMIFSPILFAATVFPQTSKYSGELMSKLIGQSFFAPVYLFLLLISIKLLSGMTAALGVKGETFSNALASTSADAFDVILMFIISIIFLIMSLKIAQQMGAVGAEKALAIGNSIRGKVQGGMSGFVGRNTIGRASDKLKDGYEKFDAKTKGSKGWNRLKTFGKVATLGAIDDRTVRKTLDAGKTAKFGGSDSYEDDDKYNKERKARQANIFGVEEFKKKVDAGISAGATPEQKIAMERAVANGNVKYFEELSQDQRKAIVGEMSQSQLDGLEKSEKLTDTEKQELKVARTENIKKIYDGNKDLLAKASAEHLDSLGAEYLNIDENAARLTSSQMDDLKKKLTRTEFSNLSAKREKVLIDLAAGTTTINTIEKARTGTAENKVLDDSYILKQKPGEIAKMPGKVLINLATKLPVASLAKIVQDGTLNKEDQAEILKKIQEGIDLATTPGSTTDTDHLNEVNKWLENNPLGVQFGK